MGIFFTVGESKKRPGVYQRYENVGGVSIAGATDGIVACCIRSNWGERNKVHTFESIEQAIEILGNGGENGTVSLLTEIFTGGAKKVYCVRLGSGGTKGQTTLYDAENAQAVTMTAKSEGDRQLSYIIRNVLGEENTKEFIVLEGTVELERIVFDTTENEMENFIQSTKKSSYFVFSKVEQYQGNAALAEVGQTDFPTGTNPTITNADYSNAFTLLEPYVFNTICIDTESVAIHTLLTAFIQKIYNEGNILPFAVIAESTSVPFETRLAHAKAINAYNVIYVGGGAIDTLGQPLEGVRAAARVAAMVASTASNQSLTHKVVTGMTDVLEMLTNSQYEQSIDAGMLTFSTSSSGNVWIESAITTLNMPQGEDDEGWKKIKRTKIRKELMNRASATVEPLIGNINNDGDGRATVMIAIGNLLSLMHTEGKLLEGGYIEVDKNNPPQGDSAWFNIYADDIDSLEKIYFVYKFRYSPNL